VTVNIRDGTIGDLDAIAALYVQLKDHHFRLQPHNPRYRVADAEWKNLARRALEDPDATVHVAELDDRVVGFSKLMIEPKPWGLSCEIDAMVVDEKQRSRGTGTELLRGAEAFARDHGAKGMRVDVLMSNYEGRAFYEREGFEIFAVRYGKPVPDPD
jgi:ribosomal protein S18 acetylase RimI-like enzyme